MEKLRAALVERGLDHVVEAICREHHVTVADVLEGRRTRNIAAARRACFVRLRGEPFRRSFPEIGELLGCDHATVRAGVARFWQDAHEEEKAA